MAISVFDSGMWAGVYRDPELAHLFSDSAQLRAMLLFEGALARAQAEAGLIPKDAADTIHRVAREAGIDPTSLTAGTAKAGVPVPALVDSFRKAMPDPGHAAWIHYGATTQDVMDTALVLCLRQVIRRFDSRLAELVTALGAQAARHRETVMAARTRGQVATPTTFGARIAAWGMPLLRHRARLAELSPRVLQVSLGGASGTRSAMGGKGAEVSDGLARELGLHSPALPWHSARDGIVELGCWAAMVTGTLAKMGTDLMLLAQSEVSEVRAGEAGASSTMAHKQNPLGAELLCQLGQAAPPALAGLLGAMPHASERDGVALAQEWMHLPALLMGCGRALLTARDLADSITVDTEAMARPFSAHQGVMFAESCTFALAAHMPRPKAHSLVKTACRTALETGQPLRRILETQIDLPLDWERLFDPSAQIGEAADFADIFAAAANSQPQAVN